MARKLRALCGCVLPRWRVAIMRATLGWMSTSYWHYRMATTIHDLVHRRARAMSPMEAKHD